MDISDETFQTVTVKGQPPTKKVQKNHNEFACGITDYQKVEKTLNL